MKTPSLRVQIATFVAVRLAFNTSHRMVYPFLSHFARGLGVDLGALSAALTARSLAGFFSPLLAWVADSHGRRAGMLFGMLLYALGVGAVVVWPTYPAFFLALVLTSVGYLVYIPSMQAYVGDRVDYAQRGLVMALTELAWSLSAILGVPLMGLLIGRAGWLAPFPLLTVLALLSIVVLARVLPKDKPGPQLQSSLWANLRRIFTYPPALAGLGMVACYSAANECVTFIYGVWVEQSFALSIASLGATALGIGVAELVGEGLVAGLTDRLGKQRAVGIGLALNCLAVLLLPLLGRWLPGALLGLFFFYLSFEFTLVSGIPLMSEVLPPARATLMAAHMAFISLGRAAGDVLAPGLFGLSGITANALAAVGFNLLAVVLLRGVVTAKSSDQ